MKIRTVEDLSNRLDEELAWRKRELGFLTFHAEGASDRYQREAILRGAHALLYAHFEGFVKTAVFYYLSHISTCRVRPDELSSRLAPFISRMATDETVQNRGRAGLYELAQLLRGESASTPRFQIKRDAVITGGNLTADRLAKLLFDAGLDLQDVESRRVLIDELLLSRRNSIAHGEYDAVSLTEYLDVRSQILALMDHVSNCIQNSAVLKLYLAPNSAEFVLDA